MKYQKGFSILEGLLILVVFGMLGFTGWYVWHVKQNIDKTNRQTAFDSQPPDSVGHKITTYDACLKARGSKLLETYPQICVTTDRQHFTQPATTNKKYLVIKEWGVKIPLSDKTADATYSSYRADITITDMMHISTLTLQRLAAEHKGCPYGINDIYLARNAPEDVVSNPLFIKKIGSYNYGFGSVTEPLCATRNDPNDNIQKQITVIQSELRNELKSVSAQ